MTNRQARREQARTTRTPRPGGGAPPTRGPRRPGAAPQRPSSGPSDFISRPFLIIFGALLLVGVIALGYLLTKSGGGGDADLVKQLDAGRAAFPAELAKGNKVGRDDAPLKLVEFEDFQCPFCLRYTAEDEPKIIEEYVKTGKVQIEFRHLPILGRESFQAAVASQCASDQNKFWDYQNLLFLTQAKAGQASGEKIDKGRFSDDNLKRFATDVGLDRAKFDECLNSDTHLQLVTDQQALAQQYGITGTPNYLVNNQAAGGDVGSIETWRKFLDEQLTRIEGVSATATANAGASPSATAASTTPAVTNTPVPATTATATATKAP